MATNDERASVKKIIAATMDTETWVKMQKKGYLYDDDWFEPPNVSHDGYRSFMGYMRKEVESVIMHRDGTCETCTYKHSNDPMLLVDYAVPWSEKEWDRIVDHSYYLEYDDNTAECVTYKSYR